MDSKTIADVYLKRKSYHQLEVEDTDIQLQYIIRYIPEDQTAPILDAGCGNGKYALKLLHMNYANISAVDLYKSITVKEISYHQAGIENLPFDDSTFQFIYSNSVIYYPSDTEKAIRELARVLRPGGLLLMTAHTRYSLFTLKRVLQRFFKSRKVRHLQDVRFKSAGEYIRLLQNNGFELLRVDGFMLSFILVPFYNMLRLFLFKYSGIKPAPVKYSITNNKHVARIKSVFAYHMVLVARKENL
jgi:ubiquinone/menaquinone biosynthesis C-methylase UbiE